MKIRTSITGNCIWQMTRTIHVMQYTKCLAIAIAQLEKDTPIFSLGNLIVTTLEDTSAVEMKDERVSSLYFLACFATTNANICAGHFIASRYTITLLLGHRRKREPTKEQQPGRRAWKERRKQTGTALHKVVRYEAHKNYEVKESFCIMFTMKTKWQSIIMYIQYYSIRGCRLATAYVLLYIIIMR